MNRRRFVTALPAVAMPLIIPSRLISAQPKEKTMPDDTTTLQNALNALPNGGTLTLEGREYRYSNNLWLQNKTGVTVKGVAGTVLRATTNKSALRVRDVAGLTLSNFTIVGSATARASSYDQCGVDAWRVSNFAFESLVVRGVGCAAIMLSGDNGTQNTGGAVRYCVVNSTLADGIHVEASNNIKVEHCLAWDTGDDAFASIGYAAAWAGGPNHDITFNGNTSLRSNASGVAIEGTDNCTVFENYVQESRVAGIRVQSANSYQTLGCGNVTVRDNILRGVKTDPTVGHGAIERVAGFGNVQADILNNVIYAPLPPLGITHYAEYSGYTVTGTVSGNVVGV